MVNLDYILEHSWGKLCYTENKLLRGLKKKNHNKLEILENVTYPTLSSWLACHDKLALVSFAIRSETAGTPLRFVSGATPGPQKGHRMAQKILLHLVLCMSRKAGTANSLLSLCTVIYGNGAQGVLRAWESWCHKVASERLVERCPAICVYANDKTRASAAVNTHVHTYSGHTVSIFSLCSSVSLFATRVPSSPRPTLPPIAWCSCLVLTGLTSHFC